MWKKLLAPISVQNGEVAILDTFQNKGGKVVHQRSPIPGYSEGGWCGARIENSSTKAITPTTCKRCSVHRHGWRKNTKARWGWERKDNPLDKKIKVDYPTTDPHREQ